MSFLGKSLLAAPLALALAAGPAAAQHHGGGGHAGGHAGGAHMGGAHPGGAYHGGAYHGGAYHGGYGGGYAGGYRGGSGGVGFGYGSPFYGYGVPFGGLGYGYGSGIGIGFGRGVYSGYGGAYGGLWGYPAPRAAGYGYGGYGGGIGVPALVGGSAAALYPSPAVTLTAPAAPANPTPANGGTDAPAAVTLVVPANAEVTINGDPVKATNGRIEYTTGTLEAAAPYYLDVKVRQGGQEYTMRVPVKAGDRSTIDLTTVR